MIRIKEFNTAYWGRIGTAATAYQFSDKVNAFIGASGSGKTTLMDALRVALGDAKFENNRAMDHYINKKSNWSVVQVAFWNREIEGQPFAGLGFMGSIVTVCVRLDKTSGDCKREYYMLNGSIDDITHLGQNPKAYQLHQVKHGEYLQRLEIVGLTSAFRKLMLMKPEDVQNVVGLDANRLFQLVFDIKGQKTIQVEHDRASEKLKEVKNLEIQSFEDLTDAKKTLFEYEGKKNEYEENQSRKAEHEKLNRLFLKKKYWDNKNELVRQQNMVVEEENKRMILENTKDIIDLGITTLSANLEIEEQKELEMKGQIAIAFNEVGVKKVEHAKAQDNHQKLCVEIEKAEAIIVEDIDLLKNRIKNTGIDLQKVDFDIITIENKVMELNKELSLLTIGENALPQWVTKFKEALLRERLPAILLAENISVKPEYAGWIKAIEAYIGRERYRIVISSEYQLQSKKLQEIFEYGARVSEPRISNQIINQKKIKDKFVSIRSALDITNEEQLGGYLDYLNKIYLVESVEEGHQLQEEGFKSLTQKGLLQDQNGSIFLKVKELVCGQYARDIYKQQLQSEIGTLSKPLNLLGIEKQNLEILGIDLANRKDSQDNRLKLPNLYIAEIEQQDMLDQLKNLLDHANEKYAKSNEDRDSINQIITELKKEQVILEAEKKVIQKDIENVIGTIKGYKGSIGSCNIALLSSIHGLEIAGYDEHTLAFIDLEIIEERILEREDGTEWSTDLLEKTVNNLTKQIEDFVRNSNIYPGIIAMVEPQKGRVDHLAKTFDLAKEDREKWENRLALAEISLKNHVQETMSQYIEEFKSMAELLGAKADGKFQQEGPSYLNWQIKMKIGFDGKELVYYDDPEFSSGQRAAISIMLLLAAVSNQKEGTKNSLMFLDEPTARVDDARANEIGTILQKSNVQYFITHQISESLKSVDWIDHALITSKIRTGQEYADNPIFESRRRQ